MAVCEEAEHEQRKTLCWYYSISWGVMIWLQKARAAAVAVSKQSQGNSYRMGLVVVFWLWALPWYMFSFSSKRFLGYTLRHGERKSWALGLGLPVLGLPCHKDSGWWSIGSCVWCWIYNAMGGVLALANVLLRSTLSCPTTAGKQPEVTWLQLACCTNNHSHRPVNVSNGVVNIKSRPSNHDMAWCVRVRQPK